MMLRLTPTVLLGLIVVACAPLATDEADVSLDTPIPPVLWFDGAVRQTAESGIELGAAELENASSPFLDLGFAGDTSFTHGLWARDPLGEVSSLLAAHDLMLVNLETTVAESGVGTAQAKEFTFKSPPSSIELLREAGIDGVALANNHALDFGRAALDRTLELLDEAGVGRAGAGADEAEAYAPMVFVREGTRIAVLSYSRILPGSWAARDNRSGIASAHAPYRDSTVEAVTQARDLADIVVVMIHWGIELEACPQAYQRDLARMWAEAGADLIIGSHPHVLQGVERIGDTWVVYSTGNFAFPSAHQQSAETALFRFTVHDDTISLRVDPLRIVAGRPRLADESSAQRVLRALTDRSYGVDFSDEGRAIAQPDAGRC